MRRVWILLAVVAMVGGMVSLGSGARIGTNVSPLQVSIGNAVGEWVRKFEFSSDFTKSCSGGVCTIAPGTTFRMENEPIVSGEVPQNIQPVDGLPKLFGSANQASLGWSSAKRCTGGIAAGATCTADSQCSGSTCDQHQEASGSWYFSTPLVLAPGALISADNLSPNVKARSSGFNIYNPGADLASWSGNQPIIYNEVSHRIIDRICCYQDAVNSSLVLRMVGAPVTAGTPFPTPWPTPPYPTPWPTRALPTPAPCATANWYLPYSGCTSAGLNIPWAVDSKIEMGLTTGSGNKRLNVVVTYLPLED